jgi:large subunit ribosomal protein LP2
VAAKEAKPEEPEEEMDLGGGMDMFGAEEGGSGGDY